MDVVVSRQPRVRVLNGMTNLVSEFKLLARSILRIASEVEVLEE